MRVCVHAARPARPCRYQRGVSARVQRNLFVTLEATRSCSWLIAACACTGGLTKLLARLAPDAEALEARQSRNRLIALTKRLVTQHRAALAQGAP